MLEDAGAISAEKLGDEPYSTLHGVHGHARRAIG
jgi:hypothetical protein